MSLESQKEIWGRFPFLFLGTLVLVIMAKSKKTQNANFGASVSIGSKLSVVHFSGKGIRVVPTKADNSLNLSSSIFDIALGCSLLTINPDAKTDLSIQHQRKVWNANSSLSSMLGFELSQFLVVEVL